MEEPIFCPAVGDFKQGMVVHLPKLEHLDTTIAPSTCELSALFPRSVPLRFSQLRAGMFTLEGGWGHWRQHRNRAFCEELQPQTFMQPWLHTTTGSSSCPHPRCMPPMIRFKLRSSSVWDKVCETVERQGGHSRPVCSQQELQQLFDYTLLRTAQFWHSIFEAWWSMLATRRMWPNRRLHTRRPCVGRCSSHIMCTTCNDICNPKRNLQKRSDGSEFTGREIRLHDDLLPADIRSDGDKASACERGSTCTMGPCSILCGHEDLSDGPLVSDVSSAAGLWVSRCVVLEALGASALLLPRRLVRRRAVARGLGS